MNSVCALWWREYSMYFLCKHQGTLILLHIFIYFQFACQIFILTCQFWNITLRLGIHKWRHPHFHFSTPSFPCYFSYTLKTTLNLNFYLCNSFPPSLWRGHFWKTLNYFPIKPIFILCELQKIEIRFCEMSLQEC